MEKPWKVKYDALLGELIRALNGKIIEVQKKEPEDDRGWGGTDIFLYPRFEFEFKGMQANIDLNEAPYFRRQAFERIGVSFEVSDNVDYLRIAVFKSNKYTLIIHPEGFADKFFKAIKLNWEFQTGIKEFDKKFLLDLESDDDKTFIKNQETQLKIFQLAPFDELAIHKTGVYWSQEVYNEKQLSFSHLEKFLRITAELADSL